MSEVSLCQSVLAQLEGVTDRADVAARVVQSMGGLFVDSAADEVAVQVCLP